MGEPGIGGTGTTPARSSLILGTPGPSWGWCVIDAAVCSRAYRLPTGSTGGNSGSAGARDGGDLQRVDTKAPLETRRIATRWVWAV